MARDQLHFDVVIVGAGAIGAATACLLSQLSKKSSDKIKIALIESQLPTPFDATGFDPRVAAITEKTRRLLVRCGAWQQIEAMRLSAYQAMRVWDAEGTGAISFDSGDIQQSNLGHIVENSVLVSSLMAQVEQCANIEVYCPAAVTDYIVQDDCLCLSLDNHRQFSTDLLIAADGANSAVREHFQFATNQWDYGQQAIVTTITTEQPNQQTAWQRFMPTGPLAFLPLNDNGDLHRCSIVWSQDTERAQQLMALSDKQFCQQLSRDSEQCLGEVLKIDKRYLIPLRQSHATDYVMPRVALIGDAAHSIHPLAGQGANLGFADAQVLVEELANAFKRDLDLGKLSVLRRYQRRRKLDNLATMGAMEGFKRLFGSHHSALRLLRNYGMSGVNKIKPLKNQLIKKAMGL